MEQESENPAGLDEISHQIARTAPRVQALLARHFPAGGGCLYPDAGGNVCVVEGAAPAADRPASVYAGCVAKLGPLVAAFALAAMDQAAMAYIRLAKERTVFACALDVARHPLDPLQRQLFVARMMPSPAPLFRQDDATATCIWQRLWTLHAWVLELRLVIALSGGASQADQAMLADLDHGFAGLVRPEAHWLSVDLGGAAAARMMARAPAEAFSVGTLVWPNRLGAMLPDHESCSPGWHGSGIGIRHEDGQTWLSLRGRFVAMPRPRASRFQPKRETRLDA